MKNFKNPLSDIESIALGKLYDDMKKIDEAVSTLSGYDHQMMIGMLEELMGKLKGVEEAKYLVREIKIKVQLLKMLKPFTSQLHETITVQLKQLSHEQAYVQQGKMHKSILEEVKKFGIDPEEVKLPEFISPPDCDESDFEGELPGEKK